MPRVIFRDFDEFADAIGGIAGRFVPTARSEADWWVQAVPVGRLSMQQLQIGGATTFAGDGTPSCITFGIPMSASRKIRVDGRYLDQNSFVLVQERQPFTFCTPQPIRWAGITVPLDHELLKPLDAPVFRGRESSQLKTKSTRFTCMRALLSRLFAEDDCVGFHDAAAIRAAEEEIIVAISQALDAITATCSSLRGRPKLSRGRVIARALELIEDSEAEPLGISDLCRATQVSERTLRNVFNEYFGVGPMRLLRIRQLREIRLALLAANSGNGTVASVAARFGVWDFSLFARNYKVLFGESPSSTLCRPPVRHRRDAAGTMTWVRYASRVFSQGAVAAHGAVGSTRAQA